jgi:hypothetical protein
MKKGLVFTLVILSSLISYAATIKAIVLKTKQDDDGIKVIIQDRKLESNPVSIYLRNDNEQFEQILAILKKVEAQMIEVSITTQSDGVTIIQKMNEI